MANQALHLTAIPLRSIAAGELVRYHPTASVCSLPVKIKVDLFF